MLNLLRFKEQADGIDADEEISGADAYRRYGEAVAPHLARAGGHLMLIAECAQTVIGPEAERWDMLVLVRYPSRQAFLGMIASPDFQAEHAHRAAALADSRLVCCDEVTEVALATLEGDAKPGH
jgi:uncharacterized protein (DUF1330 family)